MERPSLSKVALAFAQFLLVSIVAGVVAAVPFLLPVASAGKAMNMGSNFWDNLPSELIAESLPQRSRILDKNGDLIAEFYSENRINVTFDEIAPIMKRAIIAIEDDRFYTHGAVDAKGTLRAVIKTASGSGTQGGSTLTQQYVKNVLLNNAETEEEKEAATEQTPIRKIKEMKLAGGVEQKMSKDEILTGYLNIAYFGDGAYGIGAASMHFFGVPVKELKLEQAALLAGLVQNPHGHNPRTNPERAKERRDTVLMRMQVTGHISMEEKEAAQAKPIELNITDIPNGCLKSEFPFFCQMVRNTLASDPVFGETQEARQKFLYKGGLTVHTTLDPDIQRAADNAAKKALGTDNQFATGIGVVEPGTGKVMAVGTNRDFGEGEGKTQVNYATSGFQTGSTFKPFTLLAGLENGYTVDQKIESPQRWCAPPPNKGCFNNHGSAGTGSLNAIEAMSVSSNTYFLKMSADVGNSKVQEMGTRLGMRLPDNLTGEETSTTLGVYDVSPVRLANAYATIAAHGKHCNPTWISKITNSSGKEIDIPDSNCHQEVNPAIADKTAKVLTNVIDGTDPRRTGQKMSLGRPAMGKTGTTNDNAAVWFAGGTPQYQAAVWVGDPRGGYKYPVNRIRLYGEYIEGVYGSTAAGPIWKDFMAEIHKDLPVKDFTTSSTADSNRQEVVTPDVRGMQIGKALDALRTSGMKPKISDSKAEDDGIYPPDVIASQSIAPGEKLPAGKEIVLTLSANSRAVKVEE